MQTVLESMRATDIDACARILAAGFVRESTVQAARLARASPSEVRVLRDGERVLGLAFVRHRRAGFGARLVRTAGLSSLCVDPNERARGHAAAIMTGILRREHQVGMPLAVLNPARTPLYARLGFAVGGTRWLLEFDPRALGPLALDLPVRPESKGDETKIAALACRVARRGTGTIVGTRRDRRQNSRPPRVTLVVEEEGAIVGRVVLSQRGEGASAVLHVHELHALHAPAAQRLLAVIAMHGAQASCAWWRAAPDDPVVALVPDLARQFRARGEWMVRVLDVALALEARGYRRAFEGTLELEIHDPLLRANTGRFVAEIRCGRARVARGGRGLVGVDISALSSLYAAAQPSRALAATGALTGCDSDLDRLDSAFAAPIPSQRGWFRA